MLVEKESGLENCGQRICKASPNGTIFEIFKHTEYLVFKIFLQGHFLTSQNFSIRAFWEAKWKSFLKSLLMSRAYSLKNELFFEITTLSAYVQNFETLLRIFGDLCLPKRLCFHKTKLFFLSQFMCRKKLFLHCQFDFIPNM